MFVFVKTYMKRTASKIVFVCVLSLIFSRTSSSFSWKVWKYHQKLTLFHPLVNHEGILNKLRISSWTLRVSGSCQAKNIQKKNWPSVFYLTVTLTELDLYANSKSLIYNDIISKYKNIRQNKESRSQGELWGGNRVPVRRRIILPPHGFLILCDCRSDSLTVW